VAAIGAVRGVSFAIEPGELFGLLVPNRETTGSQSTATVSRARSTADRACSGPFQTLEAGLLADRLGKPVQNAGATGIDAPTEGS